MKIKISIISLVCVLITLAGCGEVRTTGVATVGGNEIDLSDAAIWTHGPETQLFMQKSIADTMALIPEDATDIQEKKIWIDASKKFCSSMKLSAKDWLGEVDQVIMSDDGSVSLDVQIDSTDNEVQDSKISKKFEDMALALKKGDLVIFSGTFKKGKRDQNQCLETTDFDSKPEFSNQGLVFNFSALAEVPMKSTEKE